MKHILIGLGLAFGLGGCLGGTMTDEPPPKFIEVPHTKIVHEPAKPPVEVPTVPDSCIRAVELTDIISRSADEMYNKGGDQLAIISDARASLAAGNKDLSSLENRQRHLQSNTVDELSDVSDALARFNIIYDLCKKELQ